MFRFTEMENSNLVDSRLFDSKAEARDYLNERVKLAKSNNNELKTYYTENSHWYSLKDLRLANDIELENLGKLDLGDSNTYSYWFEIMEIGE
jgi:hypothetical protein